MLRFLSLVCGVAAALVCLFVFVAILAGVHLS
jgi:hypothetical protein